MRPTYWLLPLAAYFYGAIPFGFLTARLIKGVDIRRAGSGNIGATNAARVLGWKFFPLVFFLDFSKGLLPPLVAGTLVQGAGPYQPHPLAVAAAAAAIAGHVFPVYLGFKGGKAVAAGTGACLVLAPWALLGGAVAWGLAFALWRYVSLASMSAAVTLAALAWIVYPDPLGSGAFRTAFATLGALLVLARHVGNIRRLLSGTEQKVGLRRKPPRPPGQ